MTRWSILLRVLLSLSLVLNGAMAVAAPMDAMHAHAGGSVRGEAVVAVDAMPCHGHHHGADAGTGRHPAASPPTPGKPAQPAPGCCSAGACACTCAQLAPAMPANPACSPAACGHEAGLAVATQEHPDPALPQLIRPPIG
ncbi:MAG TPA: CopL family metal-binding regulatory protein [Xanthomonadaceae bacterium]|nr:CopL family metal-binding regulatory protein [Xanthomonadaceae bacterium]